MNTCKIMIAILQYLAIQQSGEQKNDEDIVIQPHEISQAMLDQVFSVI